MKLKLCSFRPKDPAAIPLRDARRAWLEWRLLRRARGCDVDAGCGGRRGAACLRPARPPGSRRRAHDASHHQRPFSQRLRPGLPQAQAGPWASIDTLRGVATWGRPWRLVSAPMQDDYEDGRGALTGGGAERVRYGGGTASMAMAHDPRDPLAVLPPPPEPTSRRQRKRQRRSCPGVPASVAGLEQQLALGVRGYACELFRDDQLARWLHDEGHLIPWMGRDELLVDRYDARLLVEEAGVFRKLKSFARGAVDPPDLEAQLNAERYLSLARPQPPCEPEGGNEAAAVAAPGGSTSAVGEPTGPAFEKSENVARAAADACEEPLGGDGDVARARAKALSVAAHINQTKAAVDRLRRIMTRTAAFCATQPGGVQAAIDAIKVSQMHNR
jgi:hypothetical protein